jgi:DNA-binding response OmpR family regulator
MRGTVSKRLFLLEDDANLNETICDYLEGQGYEVVAVHDGLEAQEKLYEQSFDLLLLDVNTPGVNGFELLEGLRERGVGTPAVYITARESVEDLEKGFSSGCDDYIRKPFALRELLVRIETLLKREFFHRDRDRVPVGEGVEYEPDGRTLFVGGVSHTLGAKEAKLLEFFLRHPGEMLSHERIFDALWDYGEEPSDSSLRTYIKNLRKMIGKDRIVSLKKQGYRYIAPE